MKNWRTTSSGITAILAGITGIYFAYKANNLTAEVVSAAIGSILLGIGLIFAKDNNVTGTGA